MAYLRAKKRRILATFSDLDDVQNEKEELEISEQRRGLASSSLTSFFLRVHSIIEHKLAMNLNREEAVYQHTAAG